MLLTKKINIKAENAGFVKILRRMGYLNVYKDDNIEYEIDINKLSLNSHLYVDVKCDNCGEIKKIKYQAYNNQTKNGSEKYYCIKRECINIKRKIAVNKKYGVDNVFQLQDTKNKMKITNLKNLGVENPHQNEDIKNKAKQTCIDKYGVENPFQAEVCKEKIRLTNLERHGVEFPTQSEIIREKCKQTSLKNYGTEYPIQNKEFFDNNSISSFKIDYYKGVKYQASYELDFLKKCDEIEILDQISRSLRIQYTLNEKKHYYYPDYYIEKYNLIIEIKSDYWYKIHKKDVDAKKQACLDLRYNYIMIVNKKYDEFLAFISK